MDPTVKRKNALLIGLAVGLVSIPLLRFGLLSGQPTTWFNAIIQGPFVGLLIFIAIILINFATAIVLGKLNKMDPWWWFAFAICGAVLGTPVVVFLGRDILLFAIGANAAQWIGIVCGVIWLVMTLFIAFTVFYHLPDEKPLQTMRRLLKGDFRRS